ncbi:unnamed protein product [Ambrosiozyma monospora]|uniref:Unnamed protein product n=1 Tax=Ambrosiozyma monospora TaxID=43982 RepID=A0ACB5T1Z1_AMBMO|nr:unnamed protein product [Ambrosiozyma monospora]
MKSKEQSSDISPSLSPEKKGKVILEVKSLNEHESIDVHTNTAGGLRGHTERKLKPRHVDLIAIGGSVGTGLFVTIGTGLHYGGCGSLLVAFIIHGFLIYICTLSIGELVCYLPVDFPFITHAGRFVDPAFEFLTGYNFYIMASLYIPFEITSVNSMIHFWRDDYSPAAAFVPQIVIYLLLNVFAVGYYGESEFYLSIFKLILAFGLIVFTFITMVGGNPQHDVFGFRNFGGVHNAFPKYLGSGASAFWAAYMKAIFTEGGVEYLSMAAGEAENPRKTMPRAYKTFIYRLSVFFILGALSVSIILKHDDPTLTEAIANGAAGANVSPYVIAMKNLKIKVLPHIVNAICVSAAFSAGNSYMYCSSRSLFQLANRGFAPKWFTYTTKNGVPLAALALSVCFSMLSLMQLGSTAKVALDWMVNICTGAQVLNYTYMIVTYLHFYRACKVQGVNRFEMPLQDWLTKLQPYPAIFCLASLSLCVMFLGAQSFIPTFDKDSFLYYYLMVFVNIFLFVFWKFLKKTKFVKPEEADFITGLAEIEEHEERLAARKEFESEKGKRSKLYNILTWIF